MGFIWPQGGSTVLFGIKMLNSTVLFARPHAGAWYCWDALNAKAPDSDVPALKKSWYYGWG